MPNITQLVQKGANSGPLAQNPALLSLPCMTCQLPQGDLVTPESAGESSEADNWETPNGILLALVQLLLDLGKVI